MQDRPQNKNGSCHKMTYFAKKPVRQSGLNGVRQWLRTLTTTSLVQDTGDKKPFLCFLLEGRLEAGRLTGAWNPAREPTVQSLSVLKLARSFNDERERPEIAFISLSTLTGLNIPFTTFISLFALCHYLDSLDLNLPSSSALISLFLSTLPWLPL